MEIIDDVLVENNESFTLVLSTRLGEERTAHAIIVENDGEMN